MHCHNHVSSILFTSKGKSLYTATSSMLLFSPIMKKKKNHSKNLYIINSSEIYTEHIHIQENGVPSIKKFVVHSTLEQNQNTN